MATHTTAVVYEPDTVTAYFDANWQSCLPDVAKFAKVWTKDGGMTVLELTPAHA